jgi:RNA polymerase sigma factor (sigma-70 family)
MPFTGTRTGPRTTVCEHSVTQWIAQLKDGDQIAAARLWDRYLQSLIRLAYRKLRDAPRGVADENDIVVTAFNHFLQGVQTNRFRKLDDRHDLWQILVMLTERRAVDRLRREATASKHLPSESHRRSDDSSQGSSPLDRLADERPTPEFAVEATEECGVLLNLLPDEATRMVAIWKMEGYANREIADKLGVTERTVGRKLEEIREQWSARLQAGT